MHSESASTGKTAGHQALSRTLAPIGVGAVVLVLATASLVFTVEAGRNAVVWAPNAVVLAALLRAPRESWWRYLAAGFAGNLIADLILDHPTTIAPLLSACNLLEIWLCATFMRLFCGSGPIDLADKRPLALFLIAAGLVGPAASSTGGALILALSRGEPFLQSLSGWWAPDALGLLVITPALMALSADSLIALGRKLAGGQGVLSVAALAVSLIAVFGQSTYPLLFVLPPALILAAFELNLAGAALALLITAATAVVMTLSGHGPVMAIRGDLTVHLAILQIFLALLTFSVLPVAAALSRRERLEQSLREAHGYSQLAQAISGIGYWRRDFVTGASIWSEGMFDLHGLPQDFDVRSGAEIALYPPADRKLLIETLDHARRTGEAFDLKVRLNRADDGGERIVIFKSEVERAGGKVVAMFGVMRDVTEEETSRRQTEDSEARYRLLADSSTDIVLKVDPSGAIEYVSPSVRQYGYAPEALIGLPAYSLIHPEDQSRLRTQIRKVFTSGAPDPDRDRTYRMRAASGGYVWMEGNPTVVRDETGAMVAIVSQLRDISERRAVMAALAESELRYRIIAENASDIVTRSNANGRYTYVSPSVTGTLGYVPEELLGRSPSPYVHPDDLDVTMAAFRRRMAPDCDDRTPLRFRGLHKDGRWIWLESNPTTVRDTTGAAVEFIDMLRDVTARVRLEAEVLAARDAAVAASRAKAEFLANMSHEIRTPLTAVIGFSALLDEEPDLSPKGRRYAQRIATGGRTLLAVVNDILDFSKLEAGQIALDLHSFDPQVLIGETLELVAEQAAAKGLSLRVETEGAVPAFITADSARLRQVLLNLLTNAIKFTAAGRVDISVSHDPASGGRLRVAVSDTGQGVPKALRHRLFQRFSQVDGSISREHGGTGLGLAISQSLAELMGGKIGFDSQEGQGSTFWFTIAAPAAAAAIDTTDLFAPQVANDTTIQPARILIVDDTETNRDLVRTMLESLGHQCVEATGGAEAIDKAARERYDLILMDMQMPGMDGLTATRAIRAQGEPNRATPILALSANVLPAQIAACREAGMDDHIAKPIIPVELLQKVGYWIEHRPAAADPGVLQEIFQAKG